MSGWPEQPVIYEINTAVWLTDLSRTEGRRVTLADVPSVAWDAVAPTGVDAIWLMGVWERSPAGLADSPLGPLIAATMLAKRHLGVRWPRRSGWWRSRSSRRCSTLPSTAWTWWANCRAAFAS